MSNGEQSYDSTNNKHVRREMLQRIYCATIRRRRQP